MKELENLFDRIVQRANINLRELEFDVNPYIKDLIPFSQLVKFYGFYGITPNHPLDFQFRHSNLAGSYFLGKCSTKNSILYKSDVRGDELKHKGEIFAYEDYNIPVLADERIQIEDSFLIKTLVHCFSHDPETLEKFYIKNTVSTHYANIHGSPMDGCFLGPLSTVDLTTMNDCVIGAFAYVQAGEVNHLNIAPGTVWVRSPGNFSFLYRHPLDKLSHYIYFGVKKRPQGLLLDFVEDRKEAFQRVFDVVQIDPVSVPSSASLDRFAVIKPKMHISENVLVAQRAFLQNTWMGKGANAQENCYIINSRLEGYNVTAHGAKIIEADLDENVFVGFNSFLRGRPHARLKVGQECIIMPHTIIDIQKPLDISPGSLVWGLINGPDDLETNSISLKDFSQIKDKINKGHMFFEGNGESFVTGFRDRIHHILESNGALFDGKNFRGHAQRNQNISFNTIQPYPDGELEGIYPTIMICP
jgi:carbonic anhydrase/acetyltransferase-like protein (isoleucine patch superfamily)